MKILAVATCLWPVVLAGAAWQRAHEPASWSAAVYLAASQICHQRPERSFHTAGVQWPVCGRCSGLYLAAPLGAVVAARRLARARSLRTGLALAAIPTAVTLGAEWLSLWDVSNLMRALSALPLGAMTAFAVVSVAGGRDQQSIR